MWCLCVGCLWGGGVCVCCGVVVFLLCGGVVVGCGVVVCGVVWWCGGVFVVWRNTHSIHTHNIYTTHTTHHQHTPPPHTPHRHTPHTTHPAPHTTTPHHAPRTTTTQHHHTPPQTNRHPPWWCGRWWWVRVGCVCGVWKVRVCLSIFAWQQRHTKETTEISTTFKTNLPLVGSSSSLRSEVCNALGASDGVIHSRISQEVVCFRAFTNCCGFGGGLCVCV